MLHAKVNQMLR